MPRVLDLFAGGQGAAVGYAWAGWQVHAVDIKAHARHPLVASFTVADALDVLADVEFCRSFDLIHASPPCQRYSSQTADPARHRGLVGTVTRQLRVIGRPYVVENVSQARHLLHQPVKLCGTSFGLGVWRHRFFEISPDSGLVGPECQHGEARGADRPWMVSGDHPELIEHVRPRQGTARGRKAPSLEAARIIMGIDWMSWAELTEAIPPAYTHWIGRHLVRSLA